MKFEKDWLTPKDVAVLLGVTVRTIHNYIMSGKLNATTDDNGFKYIEKQDFFMQYPHLLQKHLEREKVSNPEKVSDSVMNKMLEEKINSLERIIRGKKMNYVYEWDTIDYYEDIYQEDNNLLKSVHSISLGDIMGEDHDIWIQKNKKFGFDIEIDNEEAQTILKEKSIHPAAVESLVRFCSRFLSAYALYCESGEHSHD